MGEKMVTEDDRRRRQKLGAWIKALRERKELTQNQAANLLGYQYFTTLSQFERGVSPLPLKLWPDMAKAYGVDPKDFATRALMLMEPQVYAMLFPPRTKTEED